MRVVPVNLEWRIGGMQVQSSSQSFECAIDVCALGGYFLSMTLVTVIETHEYARAAKALLTEAEQTGIADYLAQNPEAGVTLGHGLYKVRFAPTGEGKSGGYRTIHFHRAGLGMPVYLLAVYAKNRTSDLTRGQMDGLARVVAVIEAGLRIRQ